MFRSIGKQSGESVEKKRKATVGRICRKIGLQYCTHPSHDNGYD